MGDLGPGEGKAYFLSALFICAIAVAGAVLIWVLP